MPCQMRHPAGRPGVFKFNRSRRSLAVTGVWKRGVLGLNKTRPFRE